MKARRLRVYVRRCQVYQSALALLGHVLKYETGPTEPDVGVFLDVVQSRLEAPGATTKTRGNALWALVHAVSNRWAAEERVLGFVDLLIAIVKRTDDDPTCIINAAWALTSVCASRATNPTVVQVVTRRDVFLHLSGLLRAEFPRPCEKVAIFTNVCRMLAPVVNKVRGLFASLMSGDCFTHRFMTVWLRLFMSK